MVGRRQQDSITRADSALERKEQQARCGDGSEPDKGKHRTALT